MPNLKKISITFHTHNDNKDDSTILHVFIKNRSNTTSTPELQTDYISNHLAFEFYDDPTFAGINPYLARAENLAPGTEFDDPSDHTFDIPLRGRPIALEEIVLPVVNIHMLASGDDRWIFSYTITFLFDDRRIFSAFSDTNGVTGIILDQNNRNYSGICKEFVPLPPPHQPQTNALLEKVTVRFNTHNDNKNDDTVLNVHIVNRLNASSSQDIAIGADLFKGQEFLDDPPTTHTVVFGKGGLPLASNAIRIQDIVLPVVNINIAPSDDDRWIFDYSVTFHFDNGLTFISQTKGIILDQDNHKYSGVYQGNPFPTATPAGKAPLSPGPIQHTGAGAKRISLSFLQRKLDELINNRQIGSPLPPIRKIRLHNSRPFGDTLPESYIDVQAVVAHPPAPGTIVGPDFEEGVRYESTPTTLGQLSNWLGDLYLNDINSKSITANVDTTSPAPLTLFVDFDCSGPNETIGVGHDSFGGMDFTSFSITLKLTLSKDHRHQKVDVMSWVSDIENLQFVDTGTNPPTYKVSGTFLGATISTTTNNPDQFKSDLMGQVIDVRVVTTSGLDPGGKFQKKMREQIFSLLATRDPFDGSTVRNKLNSTVNSWLLGGVLASDANANGDLYTNGCRVNSVTIGGDDLVIDYLGPEKTFQPQAPANWPPKNFTPGTLANIDHIVVLTMENRSFDHILGYLSLPLAKGGMGRTNVDGLKGGEFNMANGVKCSSFPFSPGDTIISPNPPNQFEPVARQINGGKMDGFAQAYCDESGTQVAPRVMGYHTGGNVPVYDALVRDFAICHRWFASHPGPTFTNRFHEVTGRLNIDPDGFWEFDNSSPLRAVFTPTIFDALDANNVSWKYFETFYCFLRFFENRTFDSKNIVSFNDPAFGFVNLARTGNLPSVSFIDPHFIDLPPGGECDEPPADIQKGQQLVQKVVEAVIAGPKWSKTLLIITYDEHGGFYDHVPPPEAPRVSTETPGRYGVRVPAFVISPWVKAGNVFGHDGGTAIQAHTAGNVGGVGGVIQPLFFDHTSILKTIARRFLSQNPPYMGARYAAANDLSVIVTKELRSPQFLPFIPYNFVYGPSQKRLNVQDGSTGVGAILQQLDPNTARAQQFSFEDAGDGQFFIRTHTGNLYLTATQNGVAQDVKYPSAGSALSGRNPAAQRWRLASNSIVITQRDIFTISNAAFPGKVLQPSGNSNASGVPVVLADPAKTTGGIHAVANPWVVTSPLISGGPVVTEPLQS
jgi:phospholipase C